MKQINSLFIYLLALIPAFAPARAQETIFPGLEGDGLIEELRNAYRPDTVLTSSQAKDTLYAVVQNQDDTVRCVYSGHYLVLPEGVDPSQWLFMDGQTAGINLEHIYPVSKGASSGTQANVDMHNLYPTRVRVNSDRASFPFGEIPDALTLRWYFMTDMMSSVPAAQIDLYSEWNNAVFEPREDFKGDAARAVFYFYTMYTDQAMAADPFFFEQQRLTLLEWHISDPVSPFEVRRNELVSLYQDGKENPFILDPTLAGRAFCMDGEGCSTVSTQETQAGPPAIDVYLGADCVLFLREPLIGEVEVSIADLSGRMIMDQHFNPAGLDRFSFPLSLDAPGLYIVRIRSDEWQVSRLVPVFQ